MDKATNHMFVPEYESAEGVNFKVDVLGLLLDFKVLIKEYYAATFNEDGSALQIAFTNGQKFTLTITETTSKK